MPWLVPVLVAMAIQTGAQNPAAPLVGKWTTTQTVAPGTPMLGPPSFEVAIKDDKVIVTLERQPSADAAVYVAPREISASGIALMVNTTGPTGPRMFVIRVVAAGRAEVDMFITPTSPARPKAYVPLGVFTKGK